MKSNTAIITAHSPPRYPRQEGLTCGETNARGILEAFQIPFRPPDRLRLRIRIFGYSFIEDISRLLQSHGIDAQVQSATQMSDYQKLTTIMEHIRQDRPVLLAIGNGHLRRGVYSPLARNLIGHFITVYGYDESKQIFYIYDPYLEGSYLEKIPVGNEVRTFAQFLRDWQGPFYYRFIGMDHVYMPVCPG
jgi:hypothetical protein